MPAIDDVKSLTERIIADAEKGNFEAFVNALDDDLEVFDHMPYRFEDKPHFVQHLLNLVVGAKSVSFNFHQPSYRLISDGAAIVNAYDHFVSVPAGGGPATMLAGRTTWVYARRANGWKITSAHFSPLPKQ